MNYKDDLPFGKNSPHQVNVVVEIPKGSHNKYEYDPELNAFALDRVLFSPLHYPGDYGFIPQTLCDDGDPLDALILVSNPSYPGIVINARPIGIMRFLDGGEQDDKLLCVPEKDIRYRDTKSLKDIPQPILDEIAHFFETYKQLEKKTVEMKGWEDVDVAHKIINESIEMYKNK